MFVFIANFELIYHHEACSINHYVKLYNLNTGSIPFCSNQQITANGFVVYILFESHTMRYGVAHFVGYLKKLKYILQRFDR